MYATSTQKRFWTFTAEELEAKRDALNQAYIERHRPFLDSDDQISMFLNSDEEKLFCRIVADTGIKFGKEFKPELPPAVRWTALMYYKRFYLKTTPLEYTPKPVMMTCHFLAAKVDEFIIRTEQFVRNLKNGEPDKNAELILKTEPKLMEYLDFQLTVHSPFRAFEGHLIEMKTRLPLIDFDLEQVRKPAMEFFDMALAGDAMLMYTPTHIALAGLKYGLDKLSKSQDLLNDFLYKFLDLDPWNSREEEKQQVMKLLKKIESVVTVVLEQSASVIPQTVTVLQNKVKSLSAFLKTKLEPKMKAIPEAPTDNGVMSDDSDE
ncbi:hypothetical protein FO519_000807 [Halicephalobus sp. NKZ332]|nr:hypothetical protein FO519_000807 [Halicephalobus sp. NKZ332]